MSTQQCVIALGRGTLHNRSMTLIALFIAGLASLAPAAQKTSYPAHRMSAEGIKEIRVSGVKGKLVLKAREAKLYTIKVNHTKGKKGEDWHLSVERQRDALVIEVFSTEYGREWRNQVRRESWPEFDIELEGPSQPATLAWREGAIEVANWKSALEVSFLKGPFTAAGMRAALKVQAVDSDVRVRDHRGALDIKGENGSVEIRGVEGATKFHWVQGRVLFDRTSGEIEIDQTGGDLRVRGGSGVLNAKMASGKAEVESFKGKIKAEGDSRWSLTAAAPSEVEVLGKTNDVTMKWRSGGVKLFLSTAKGKIEAPASMPVEVRGGIRVVEVDIEPKPKGQVFLRTDTGKIVWRR